MSSPPDDFKMNGEFFNSSLRLNKMLKVTRTKNWLFVWVSKLQAYIIPVSNTSAAELAELKTLLGVNGVKNNL